MTPSDVVGNLLLVAQSQPARGLGLRFDLVGFHPFSDRVVPHDDRHSTGNSRKMSTGILRRPTQGLTITPAVPQNLLGELRKRLKDLKKTADLDDTAIAVAMNELAPDVTAYQQKVSDFFSGEMKRPDLDFLSAICMALGQQLSGMIAAIEHNTDTHRDLDWEWIMFGRRLGPMGRDAAKRFVDGGNGARVVPPAAAKQRRAGRRKRGGA